MAEAVTRQIQTHYLFFHLLIRYALRDNTDLRVWQNGEVDRKYDWKKKEMRYETTENMRPDLFFERDVLHYFPAHVTHTACPH